MPGMPDRHASPRSLTWRFPIARVHAGVPLGNGVQGLLIHGAGRRLIITVGRAGFWDHRGGNDFTSRTTFAEVRRLLEAHDADGLRRAFRVDSTTHQDAGRPHQIGGGRIEIDLGEGWQLLSAELQLDCGRITVQAARPDGGLVHLAIRQASHAELSLIEVPPQTAVRVRPSWDWVGQELSRVGCQPPTRIDGEVQGFVQTLPADPGLAIACRRLDGLVAIASAIGDQPWPVALAHLQRVHDQALWDETARFWTGYWDEVPRICCQDPLGDETVQYGLYKQACTTPPQGVACTLQGPFMEEYQLPPWSNDYHFNINAQMIYAPALTSNRLAHLDPLWAMIRSWWPRLQANAAAFFQTPQAMMLPHAVDDRCQVVGNFWTGAIDHGCTAWMALLAWQHYRHGLDADLLCSLAWPLLLGAFHGYRAMLEQAADGTWHLPVSTSPEYRGKALDAWGRDASFQLAAFHRVCRILPQAAIALGEPIDPVWADLAAHTPPYSLVEGFRSEEHRHEGRCRRIGLWQGQDLDDSHRHHSHLAGIWPFCTVDPADPAQQEVIRSSLHHWTRRGAGAWSGWCVPWASILWSRCGVPDAALAWLQWWRNAFVNEGRGTMHNAFCPGLSVIADGWSQMPGGRAITGEVGEIMQLDAGFGALSAVLEMLCQQHEDTIHLPARLPRIWEHQAISFDRLRTEGAFQVGAEAEGGSWRRIRIRSLAGGTLRLRHGWSGCRVGGAVQAGPELVRYCHQGEELTLEPGNG